MTKSVDFYFDFISPYSFLAYKKFKSLDKKNRIKINYKPILLGGLHKLGEIVAPAFNKRKMKNMKNDCELVAKKNDIKFKWNDKFPINSLYLMRGYLIIDDNLKKKFFDLCFDAYWKHNIDISNTENVKDILKGSENKKINDASKNSNLKNKKTKESLGKILWVRRKRRNKLN